MVMGGRMVCLVQTCSREKNLAVGDSSGAQELGHVFGHVRRNLLAQVQRVDPQVLYRG